MGQREEKRRPSAVFGANSLKNSLSDRAIQQRGAEGVVGRRKTCKHHQRPIHSQGDGQQYDPHGKIGLKQIGRDRQHPHLPKLVTQRSHLHVHRMGGRNPREASSPQNTGKQHSSSLQQRKKNTQFYARNVQSMIPTLINTCHRSFSGYFQ